MKRRSYSDWTSREWNMTTNALNEELPPEKCGVELTPEERASYLKDLEWLKKERAENPGMPISFSMMEKETE